MRIAVEGCSHGELDVIYKSILKLEEIHNFKIDLLLCCGDFQAVRNEQDLKCMAVPMKYMKMQDFHKYYSGEKTAPVLTIFIGGNHEASSYLQELPYGGWVAPNIYYLGYASVVKFGNLRIGGLSGIYKGPDYLKGHFEKPPYSSDSIRSVYHVRNLEVFRLKQLSGHMDVFMSHDWPRGIYHHGNVDQLLNRKGHFESEIKNNTLGSRAAEDLIKKIRPDYWFSGHLHVKFSALMTHENDMDNKPKVTKFLALDKCLPRREFMQILEIPSKELGSNDSLILEHDPEWLTILRLTKHLTSTEPKIVYMPGPGSGERYHFTPVAEEIEETVKLMDGNLKIPSSNFVKTSYCYRHVHSTPKMDLVSMPEPSLNPQTKELCEKLNINDPLELLLGHPLSSFDASNQHTPSRAFNKSEMNVTMNSSRLSLNCDEISCSDDEDLASGDIIFEMSDPAISSDLFNSDLLQQVSPIRKVESEASRKSPLEVSPLSSSPKVAEDAPRKLFELSKPKYSHLDESPSSKLSTLHVHSSESSPGSAYPLSSSSETPPHPNSCDSLDDDADIPGSDAPLKRHSEDSDNSTCIASVSTPSSSSKKLRRRNAELYMSEG